MALEPNIIPLDPVTFEYQDYSQEDSNLIAQLPLDTDFSGSTDYIEYYVYDQNSNLLFPEVSTVPLNQYTIKEGDVLLDPSQNLRSLGYIEGDYIITYDFYRNRCASNLNINYFIEVISSDRTEIQLSSNTINPDDVINFTNEFINYRNDADYFVDFFVNLGNNRQLIANNIQLNTDVLDEPKVQIKLYEPLPTDITIKTPVWIVEEISTPQAYKVEFPIEEIQIQDFEYIKGPNLSLNVTQQVGESSDVFNYSTLTSTSQTSSLQQLTSLLKEKGININVNYSDFTEFIKFSSAQKRIENFYTKVSTIESTQISLSESIYGANGATTASSAYSESKAYLESIIDETINNFDDFEYFMYYNSGSIGAWPKSTSIPPYKLYSTSSTEVLEWYGSTNPDSPYYGGRINTASNYDSTNKDYLYNTIPEYLVEDPENQQYELFLDMIGQHFDNIWVYTKDVTNKFNADNRLDYGISKDLVADAIRDFGVKLYSNRYDTDDLYRAFLGITSEGNTFPVSNITSSLPIASGSGVEYVKTQVSASTDIIPQNDVLKSVYKRLYHNIPYLLKTKGTHAGLRVLINSFGIPESILDSIEYGGSTVGENTYDNVKEVFNYTFNMTGSQSVETSWNLNTDWSASYDVPNSLVFRFKPELVHSSSLGPTNVSESLFHTDNGLLLALEYSGSSGITSSYSGSSVSDYYQYGNLNLYTTADQSESASVYLPFYNGDYYSVMINLDSTESISLYAKSKSSNYQATQRIGFASSSSIATTSSLWISASNAYFGKLTGSFPSFSGSLQEIRYYTEPISQSIFNNFVVNPNSFDAQSPTGSQNKLAFRASLGGELYTGSTSIHPKVTGSWIVTGSTTIGVNSFATSSDFTIISGNFVAQTQKIAANETPLGIRSQVTDKVIIATTSSQDILNSNTSVLSPMRSVQQKSYPQKREADARYLEVAFSPQDQINKDIINQLGYFNLGDYIGNFRQWSDDTNNYPDLDKLRDQYFTKYLHSYDLRDFVRLIKFFDNSLFKMIKDFVPSSTSLSAGVVVKQHLLERSRIRPVQTSYSNVTYSGSIKPQSRNYSTGSSDRSQYDYVSGSSIYEFSGGPGGSFNRYQNTSKTNYFALTQSWSELVQTISGSVSKSHSDEAEFIDGIFGAPGGNGISYIDVVTGTGGVDCSQFTNPTFEDTRIVPVFMTTNNFSEEEFLSEDNYPRKGVMWLWYTGSGPISYIKINNTSYNDIDITSQLSLATDIPVYLNNPSSTPYPSLTPKPSGFYEWEIIEKTTYDEFHLFVPNQATSTDIVYSEDSALFNITFDATGEYIWWASGSGTPTNPSFLTGSATSIPQGYFPASITYPTEQFFKGWGEAQYLIDYNDYIPSGGGVINDPQGLFNPAAIEVNTAVTTSNDVSIYGVYTAASTEPWFMNASQSYNQIPDTEITDIDGGIPRKNEVVAILLTPTASGCSTLNNNSAGQTIAVRYDGNQALFTTDGSGNIILKEGVNGTATVKDITLYDSADSGSVVWHPDSISKPATTPTNLAFGNYGVYKLSAENFDEILLQLGDVNGQTGIEIISYCP